MFRTEIWLTTTLVAIGIIGGLLYNWPREDHSASTQQAVSAGEDDQPRPGNVEGFPSDLLQADPPEAALENNDRENPIDDLATGDRYLFTGNNMGAYQEYLKLAGSDLESISSPLALRLGISTEQDGRFALAEKFYRVAVQSSGRRQTDKLFALSGLSRVWLEQERYGDAQELLSDLLLRFGTQESTDPEVRMQIAYQLSVVVSRKILSVVPTRYGQLSTPQFHWCEPDIQAMIAASNEGGHPVEEQAPIVDQLTINLLQRPADDVNLIALDAFSPTMSLTEILNGIAESSELTFELSDSARAALPGRSARLNARGLPLSLLLDTLLTPIGIFWQQEENLVRLTMLGEQPDQVMPFRFEQADRMLRRIELTFPRNERRSAALLHRGSFAMMTEKFDFAGARFLELADVSPNGELGAKLSFNRGIVELAADRREPGIRYLFHAVDQSFEYQFQSEAYGWIGRVELAQGNAASAVYASSRGLSLANKPDVREDNLMTLARGYLLDNNPHSANKALFDNRDAVLSGKSNRLASALGAYSRYLGTTRSGGLRDEGERLLIALMALKPDDPDGFVDEMLIGRAFFEVGLTNRSSALFQLALEHATDENWQRRIAFELASLRRRDDDIGTAKKIFEEIAKKLIDQPGIMSQINLAELSIDARDPARCLELCLQLWQLPLSSEQKLTTLDLMGRSYQQLGRHRSAAVCFSGMVPHDSAGVNGIDPAQSPGSANSIEVGFSSSDQKQ